MQTIHTWQDILINIIAISWISVNMTRCMYSMSNKERQCSTDLERCKTIPSCWTKKAEKITNKTQETRQFITKSLSLIRVVRCPDLRCYKMLTLSCAKPRSMASSFNSNTRLPNKACLNTLLYIVLHCENDWSASSQRSYPQHNVSLQISYSHGTEVSQDVRSFTNQLYDETEAMRERITDSVTFCAGGVGT